MKTTIHQGVIREKRLHDANFPRPFSDAVPYQCVMFEGSFAFSGPFFAMPAMSEALDRAIESRASVELEIAEHFIPKVGSPLVSLKVDGKTYAMRPVEIGMVRLMVFNLFNLFFWILGLLTLPLLGGVWILQFAWQSRSAVGEYRRAMSTLNKHLRSIRGPVEFV